MGIKSTVKINRKKLDDIVLKAANEQMSEKTFDVTCPHCQQTISIKPGKSICPNCEKEVDLNLNIRF